ncbi:tRNA pseudouridine(38-40) synthase TruA [Marinirhabdus gelatinilytica]|uniref:tRNA pseudouridine synthase A n=1 Tax=Marinirhabdus gelatinilytica TaxID=1703343 RepID=A0A370Q8K8_9FLAO|nr:tRNA pseudouridine(38-40) synthase TruA [Marinirhabdus gelatinilytica]RDK84701.1 tRNA pseudouridine(38-40) synthase [Marinirhabdus gelatinilytica]
MRYFIEIAYNGTHYHGWQIQPNALSVQAVVEQTLSTFFRNEIKVVGAGRTDAGVHAKQLFAHFDLDETIDAENTIYKLNSFLPKDISVQNILRVTPEAHARFSATSREYEYVVSLGKDPFAQELAYQIHRAPNMEQMNKAAEILLHYSDFQCFSRSNTDVKTYLCDVKKAVWEKQGDTLLFTITADRFLRNMVRAVVGTLLDVGFDKVSLEDVHTIIKSKDRGNAGASVPAHGLYLTKVSYPETIFLTA